VKSVGIKALKDNLSKYLKLVKGGETILVTDRDEVIAEIHQPTRHLPVGMSRLQAFLHEQSRIGNVTLAAPAPAPSLSKLRQVPRPRVPVDMQALMDTIRAE